jgi:hypothetical protein
LMRPRLAVRPNMEWHPCRAARPRQRWSARGYPLQQRPRPPAPQDSGDGTMIMSRCSSKVLTVWVGRIESTRQAALARHSDDVRRVAAAGTLVRYMWMVRRCRRRLYARTRFVQRRCNATNQIRHHQTGVGHRWQAPSPRGSSAQTAAGHLVDGERVRKLHRPRKPKFMATAPRLAASAHIPFAAAVDPHGMGPSIHRSW